MTKERILSYSIMLLVVFGCLYLCSLINTTNFDYNNENNSNQNIVIKESAENIPLEYNQELDLNGTFVYNVTQFEGPLWWWSFDGNKGFFNSSSGNKILVNFTGFYDKHAFDGSCFSEPVPYINITFVNNRTLCNVSNTEAADAMGIGYNNFDSGFLIPTNNMTKLKELATIESSGLWSNGIVTIEESYNFIYISYEQTDGPQKTYMIYERSSGLLIWAKTFIFGFKMEIYSLNYTFDYSLTYNYTVNDFTGPLEWSSFDGPKGYINSSAGNHILVNFTGYYDKHAFDGSCFSEPIPYINITFVNNRTMYNVSNTEAADAMFIGYNNFDSGFLIPTDNITKLKELATIESFGLTNGIVSIEETMLTIKFTYDQIDGDQFTSLIYDIRTGLLLWVHTETNNYVLELTINGITPGEYTIGISNPSAKNDYDEVKVIKKTEISEDSLILFTSIASIVATITTVLALYASKIKNLRPKFILIGIIGVACFTGLITYSYGLIPFPTTLQEKSGKEVEDITLIVDYGDGNIKKWEDISIDGDDATVFEVLKEYCEVEYEDYGDKGVLVTSIDGYKNGEHNWFYGVNGEKIGYSCSKYELEDGDVINWVYSDDYSPP
ncbi:MAG: DUF4430 domain-containing protein [Promethearchaeota archaeon]